MHYLFDLLFVCNTEIKRHTGIIVERYIDSVGFFCHSRILRQIGNYYNLFRASGTNKKIRMDIFFIFSSPFGNSIN